MSATILIRVLSLGAYAMFAFTVFTQRISVVTEQGTLGLLVTLPVGLSYQSAVGLPGTVFKCSHNNAILMDSF